MQHYHIAWFDQNNVLVRDSVPTPAFFRERNAESFARLLRHEVRIRNGNERITFEVIGCVLEHN